MTAPKSNRINVRLSPERARKTTYLEQRLNLSTTEVIHLAIDRYYAEVSQKTDRAEEILSRVGFVACAEGPADLSQSHKTEFARSSGKKA